METICDADCILALEHGKIVAKGNYKELVDQGIIKPIEKGNRQVEKN